MALKNNPRRAVLALGQNAGMANSTCVQRNFNATGNSGLCNSVRIWFPSLWKGTILKSLDRAVLSIFWYKKMVKKYLQKKNDERLLGFFILLSSDFPRCAKKNTVILHSDNIFWWLVLFCRSPLNNPFAGILELMAKRSSYRQFNIS